jgi:hypothetical protein
MPIPDATYRAAAPFETRLKNCANSLYISLANLDSSVNKINGLAPKKTGCESCRPSQFHR